MDTKRKLLASLGQGAAGFLFGALTMVVHGLTWHGISVRAWVEVGRLTERALTLGSLVLVTPMIAFLLAVRAERRWVCFSAGLLSYFVLAFLQMSSPIYQFERHLVFHSFGSSYLILLVGAALATAALPFGVLNRLPLDVKLSPKQVFYVAIALQVNAMIVSRVLLWGTSWAPARPPSYQIAMTVVFGTIPALLYAYAALAVVTRRLRSTE